MQAKRARAVRNTTEANKQCDKGWVHDHRSLFTRENGAVGHGPINTLELVRGEKRDERLFIERRSDAADQILVKERLIHATLQV